jgi:hypothetical protein
VSFPASLDGGTVRAELAGGAFLVGPRGAPLPIASLVVGRPVADVVDHVFLLVEASYEGEVGTAPVFYGTDVPLFRVVAGSAEFEPSDCGPIYYDVLGVLGEREFELRRGDRATVSVANVASPWTVAHVVSWHHRRACEGEARAWTQFAAWR